MRILLLCLLLWLASCSLLEQQGVSITARLATKGAYEIETDRNLVVVKQALPANLKFLEGMWYVQPDNKNLLLSLLKGYAGLAFVVNETALLEEQLKDEQGAAYRQTVLNYSKAIEYGLRLFKEYGVTFEQLVHANKHGTLDSLLSNSFDLTDDFDYEAVFYFAQALGSLINVRKNDMALIAQVSLVKSLFDSVCSRRPDFQQGACSIFYASYAASRPKMLGGDPEKGQQLFLQAIKKWPHNYLIRITYIQNYIIPLMDETAYQQQAAFFKKVIKEEKISWSPKNPLSVEDHAHLNLFNQIAIDRFKIIDKFAGDIF